MNEIQPTPILVVGKNRSGTKWLSNILCGHSEVSGVQSQRHTGILETNLFTRAASVFGDLTRTDNYVAFVEAWSQTDFFRRSGLEKELFYRARPRPTSYLAVLSLVMTEFARQAGTRFWLQKLPPLHADRVISSFPSARIVTIEREMFSNLESEVQLGRSLGLDYGIPRAAFHYVLQQKALRRLSGEHPVVRVNYAQLRTDLHGTVARVCQELGLVFEPPMLESAFRKNTSFANGTPRIPLSARERAMAAFISRVVEIVPLRGLSIVHDVFRTRAPGFIRGTFSEIAEMYGLDG